MTSRVLLFSACSFLFTVSVTKRKLPICWRDWYSGATRPPESKVPAAVLLSVERITAPAVHVLGAGPVCTYLSATPVPPLGPGKGEVNPARGRCGASKVKGLLSLIVGLSWIIPLVRRTAAVDGTPVPSSKYMGSPFLKTWLPSMRN